MSAPMQYGPEAHPPEGVHDAIRYQMEETMRRAHFSTDGLSDDDLSADPGHGAWTIGQLLKHQLNLARNITENLQAGATADLDPGDIGEQGAWHLAAIIAYREALNARCLDALRAVDEKTFMGTRPDIGPKHWQDWPMLMRILRMLTDWATHVGQVNYARRQLDKPVAPN